MNNTERQEWLAHRKTGIGGTDMAGILNEGYGCRRKVFYDKVGAPPDHEEVVSNPMLRGQALEGVFLKEFFDRHGWEENRPCLPLNQQKEDWVLGTPDAFVGKDEESAIVEVKTVGEWPWKQLRKAGVPKREWEIQLNWYLYKWDIPTGIIWAGWADGWEFTKYELELDKDLAEACFSLAKEFWSDVSIAIAAGYTEPDDAPSGLNYERLPASDKRCKGCPWSETCQRGAVEEALRTPFDGEVTFVQMSSDPRWGQAATDYKEALFAKTMADEELKEVKSELQLLMNGRPAAEGDGLRIHHKPVVSNRFDTKGFRAKHPQLAEEFTKPTTSKPFKVYLT